MNFILFKRFCKYRENIVCRYLIPKRVELVPTVKFRCYKKDCIAYKMQRSETQKKEQYELKRLKKIYE